MPSKTRAMTVAQGIARNAGKQCSHPGCYNTRHDISKWCIQHFEKARIYGHPLGHHIYKKDYAFEKSEVTEFLKKHRSHAGVHAATKWLDEWMNMFIAADPEEASKQPVGIDTMNRLRAAGITPLDVLIEVSALWLYSIKSPAKLPDDQRLTVALSRAVYYLTKAHKRQSWTSNTLKSCKPTAKERDGIGGRIRDTLGLLLNNIAQGIAAQYKAKAEVKASFAAPFDVSPEKLL